MFFFYFLVWKPVMAIALIVQIIEQLFHLDSLFIQFKRYNVNKIQKLNYFNITKNLTEIKINKTQKS